MVGNPEPTYRVLQKDFTFSKKKVGFSGGRKLSEGNQLFYVADDLCLVSAASKSVVINTLSRAKKGLPALLVDTVKIKTPFPRAAFDPVSDKIYVLYPNYRYQPTVAICDPGSLKCKEIRVLAQSEISFNYDEKTRGPGAGGIAPHHESGVHVVYSINGKIVHEITE